MDVLLGRVTQQAVNYAIRSGVTITAGYAIQQCGRLLKETPRGSKERDQLVQLQLRLDSKIRIISPAIDMIELIATRGNTSLESAVILTREIRYDIQSLGSRLDATANDEQLLKSKSRKAKSREQIDEQLRRLVADIKGLLLRIEDAVPLMNLAITTSGVNLSTNLSGMISPSRLLQASWFLAGADRIYSQRTGTRVPVGPTYTLSAYMLFAGHARNVEGEDLRNTTWKEVIHKARVKLVRLPLDQLYERPGNAPSNPTQSRNDAMRDDSLAEFAYQLLIVEDLDDDRVHTFEDDEPQPGPLEDVPNAGIRDVIPVHEISKIFYADTGKILNIGGDSETNRPVLLLRRDVHAEPPRQMMREPLPFDYGGRQADVDAGDGLSQVDQHASPWAGPDAASEDQIWRLPADLDPEWIAFEVYEEHVESDSDDEDGHALPQNSRPSPDSNLERALSRLALGRSSASPARSSPNGQIDISSGRGRLSTVDQPIKTTLSLLEMLLKLTALQQFRQQSHMTIGDELLNFFLEDSATAGSGPDRSGRQRMRHDAVSRVGFDPYDESPIKRRGEDYIGNARGSISSTVGSPASGLEGYGSHRETYEETISAVPSIERDHARDTIPSSPPTLPDISKSAPYHSSTPNSPVHPSSYAARMGLERPSSLRHSLASSPSTAQSRRSLLRKDSLPKSSSPLAK